MKLAYNFCVFSLCFFFSCFLFSFSASLTITNAQGESSWNSFIKCFPQRYSFQAIIQIHSSPNRYDEYVIADTQLNWKLDTSKVSFQQMISFASWKKARFWLLSIQQGESSLKQVGPVFGPSILSDSSKRKRFWAINVREPLTLTKTERLVLHFL